MSWTDCIDRALTAKRITGKKADEARERYKNLYDSAIRDGMSPTDAEDYAAENATRQIEVEKAQKKARQLKQMAWSIDNYRNTFAKGGAKKLRWNAQAMIEGTVGSTPGIISMNDHVTTAQGRLESFLADMIDKYSPKLAGLYYPKAGLENIVRELFRVGSTGDKTAEALAKAWTKATDLGVSMYQRAGGILNHLEEWRLPQMHDRIKLYKIGAETWIDDHMNWLDWNKMQWPNGARIDPADRRRVLGEVFKTMKTGGDIRIEPGQYRGAGGGGISDHRFLIYKDADSWLASHGKYGHGSIYDVMHGHVATMAKRIGVAHTFGPSPAMGLEQAISNLKRVAAEADVAAKNVPRNSLGLPTTYKDEATVAENFLRDAFAAKVRGANAPENGSAAIMAGLFSNARTLIMSAVGGSVYLYQGTQDFFTAALRYRMAKLPVMHATQTYLKIFTKADRETPKLLRRASFINLSQSHISQALTRLTGLEPEGSTFTRRLSDTIMRASLTEWHAASARFTTAAEFCGALADWRDLPFDEVPGKSMFESHGITAADWDKMRATPVNSTTGHDFLFPDDHIFKTANGTEDERYEVADKFMSMINQEAKLATIETQVSAQLALKGATRPGTLLGEVARSIGMFKNFPLTLANTHIRTGLLKPTIPGKIGYTALVIGGMTAFGAVGVMLHDVAYGKNPQSLRDPEFWARALFASGGAGIIGDLVAGNLEHGNTVGETLGGPLISEGSDLIDLAGATGKAAFGVPNQHVMRKVAAFGGRWSPGSTLWYLRAPLRAMIWDNLLKATDPQAASVFRRRAQFARKNNQSYWWGPGEALPNSAPDLTALTRKE